MNLRVNAKSFPKAVIAYFLCMPLCLLLVFTDALSQTPNVNGKIYWTVPRYNMILRASIDGSEIEEVVTSAIYFYRLLIQSPTNNQPAVALTKKMTLLR